MEADPPTVLVTGATGFVGGHLGPALAASGWTVRGAARRPTAAGLPGYAQVVGIADIGPETDWKAALDGMQAVVHLAAVAHRTDPRAQPSDAEFMRVNAGGTHALAAAARRAGSVRKFLYISSIGAVTDESAESLDETARTEPVSPYGRSKRAGEEAVAAALGGSGLDWCVLRPVLVYGPGNPGNMERLLRLVRSGLPLPLDGIRNSRSFVYVGNLVGAIAACLRAEGLSGRTFHVADDEVASTPQLIRLIAAADRRPARLLNVPIGLLQAASRAGDLSRRLGFPAGLDGPTLRRLAGSLTVSNLALREATGWRPRATLAAGIAATLGGAVEETR